MDGRKDLSPTYSLLPPDSGYGTRTSRTPTPEDICLAACQASPKRTYLNRGESVRTTMGLTGGAGPALRREGGRVQLKHLLGRLLNEDRVEGMIPRRQRP